MTVKIGEMTATFADSQVIHTAIGMNVTDNGSDANSKLLNLSVNSAARFTIFKDGRTQIRTDFDNNSQNVILTINNSNNNIMSVSPNNIHLNVDTKSTTHFFVKSYSEAAVDVGSSLVFDLNKGSVFICNPEVFDSATFIKPVTSFSNDPSQAFTCTVIVRNAATADNTVWQGSNVIWPNLNYPEPAGNVAVYNFMNIGANDIWYAFHGGENFML